MKQYFFKIEITYTDKNKLFKEFREWIQKQDGTLLTREPAYNIFKNDINAAAVNLNRKHARCKPIGVQFFKFKETDNEEVIHVSGSWTAQIYKVQHKN